MSTLVYRISVLLGAILVDVPVGTNLGLFWLLWALISGRFLVSRGAVFPALADGGLPADAVHRSIAALAYGRWAIQSLVRAWHQVVQQEGRWHAHRYEGFRPVACDRVGFFRPNLHGCVGKHYPSGADTKPCRPSSWPWWRRLGRSAKCACPCCVWCGVLTQGTAVKPRCNAGPSYKPERSCNPTKSS